MPADVFRRFIPTPLEHLFEVQATVVKVETNRQLLADRLLAALPPSLQRLEGSPAFTWRIVVEGDDDLEVDLESLPSHHLSQNGLALVNIGQKSFLACDLRAHEGVSFVSERLINNERLFQRYFLPALISLLNDPS